MPLAAMGAVNVFQFSDGAISSLPMMPSSVAISKIPSFAADDNAECDRAVKGKILVADAEGIADIFDDPLSIVAGNECDMIRYLIVAGRR